MTGDEAQDRIALARHSDTFGNESAQVLELAWLNSRFETGLRSPLDAAMRQAIVDVVQRELVTPRGLRTARAMLRAASTSSACNVVDIDQPTTRRLNTSSTTAR